MTQAQQDHRFGRVLLCGRPNIGKSTLLNRLLGEQLSIVTRKRQTTRTSIAGILHRPNMQLALVDSPGLSREEKDLMARNMRQATYQELEVADAVVLLAAATGYDEETGAILKSLKTRLKKNSTPLILALNKADQVRPRSHILATVERFSSLYDFAAIVPLSAQKKENLDVLLEAIRASIPKGPPQYPDSMRSELGPTFTIAEIIRQQVVLLTRQELPYATCVVLKQYHTSGRKHHITASIIAERASQRAILIGKQGRTIAQIRIQAETNLYRYLNKPVALRLWVEVHPGWRNDAALLEQLNETVHPS